MTLPLNFFPQKEGRVGENDPHNVLDNLMKSAGIFPALFVLIISVKL
jgi:hypothetical protein